jgi:glyoxylase-like metal-dependent hydrolase (beta-lactamase superfamily II)
MGVYTRIKEAKMSFRWAVTWMLAGGCVGAYAPARPAPPPPLTHNHERLSLERAVKLPHPSVRAVMLLANEYMSAGQDGLGYAYFTERAAGGEPLFVALSGLFAARIAGEVPLLRRVAWVEGAIEKLDRAVAATAASPGLERYLRGIVYADLPARFGKAATAISDLEWMLSRKEHFPPGLLRGAWAGLAKAYRRSGRGADAERARAQASDGGALASDFSVGARSGFRFGPKSVVEPVPGIWVVRGYDFADLAFVATDDGLVAIDAGTTQESVKEALQALRARTELPIRHVIITHAHWDHIGGIAEVARDGAEVIAQSQFEKELAVVNGVTVPFRFFFGRDAHGPYSLSPTRLIEGPETLTIGGKRFELIPAHGGETADALLIHLPDEHVVFVGDVFMPYLGAPFAAEGSPEGLLDAIERLGALQPRRLIHGHTPLTENFQMPVLAPLGAALDEVRRATLAAIYQGRPLAATLDEDRLPESLGAHPDAVLPFLLMRDNLIKRIYAQHTGYWKTDGEGMEVFSPLELGRALDLVADGRVDAFARAARSLVRRGDFGMALRVAELGLAAHPDERALVDARLAALQGLRVKYQIANPFKFLIYSEMAGRELSAAPGR